MPAAGAVKQPFYEWRWEGGSKRQKGISTAGERGRGEAGQVVCCVWVGETRLRGACGGAGYVCVRKWLEAEEELGVGPHTYTLPFSQALCVCVLFMPLLRRCAIWNKGPIWAVLTLKAAHLADTAESVLRMRSNRHTATFHQFHRTGSSCFFLLVCLSVGCESFADTFFMLLRCEIHPAAALRCFLLSQDILITLPLLLTFIPIGICSFSFLRCCWICSYLHIYLHRLLSCVSTGAALFSSVVLPVINGTVQKSVHTSCWKTVFKPAIYTFFEYLSLVLFSGSILYACDMSRYSISIPHTCPCLWLPPPHSWPQVPVGNWGHAVQFDAQRNSREV